MEVLEEFPKNADALTTEAGRAVLVKTDIFKRLMFYGYEKGAARGRIFPLEISKVKEILALNKKGEKPLDLQSMQISLGDAADDIPDYGDVTGVVELPMEKKKKRRKNRNRNRNRNKNNNNPLRIVAHRIFIAPLPRLNFNDISIIQKVKI